MTVTPGPLPPTAPPCIGVAAPGVAPTCIGHVGVPLTGAGYGWAPGGVCLVLLLLYAGAVLIVLSQAKRS
ncbi:MAG: hypothetical protein ABR977_13480 [Candidatus Dormibacteria bacterium]